MKKIEQGILINDEYFDKDDLVGLIKLQKMLLIHTDTLYTIEECINIWNNHSSDYTASWLDLPDDENIFIPRIESTFGFTSFEEYSKIN